ncbi:MAG: baseplate J/gp47 family protein [Bacteroidota bacterium]
MLRPLNDRNQSFLNPGTSRATRKLPALDPEYLDISMVNLPEFAHFLRTFAPLVTFYDTNDQPKGSWAEMFEEDLTIKLIHLKSFVPDTMSTAFADLLQQLRTNVVTEVRQELLERVFVTVGQLFIYVEELRLASRMHQSFRHEIRKLIRDRFVELRIEFQAYLEDVLSADGLQNVQSALNFQHFGSDWEADPQVETYIARGDDPNYRRLQRLFTRLLDYVRLLRDRGIAVLQELMDSGNVMPHVATLLAFHEMARIAGNDLNQFTHRHLEYYYREVLQLKERGGKPDQVHVVFELAQNNTQLLLPAGIQLDAGEDATGVQRIYRLNKGIVLNKTKIGDIRCLLHDGTPPRKPIFPRSDLEVDTVFVNKHSPDPREQMLEGIGTFLPGIAIGSPILDLDPANSLVRMEFHFENESFSGFRDTIVDEALQVLGPIPEGGSPDLRFLKVQQLIRDLLSVTYTGPEGEWITVDPENVEFKAPIQNGRIVYPRLELEILFSPGDPPIAPCVDPEYGGAVEAEVPLFRMELCREKAFLYHTLVDLLVERVEIEVRVLDMTSLVLQNDFGPLDANVPFQPFGPFPALGSCFFVGHPRIFNRNLKSLKINLEWFEVPGLPQGLVEYYEDYQGIARNEDFEIAISILENKTWKPREDRQVVSLFHTLPHTPGPDEEKQHRVSKVTKITNLDMNKFQIQVDASRGELLMYRRDTLNGFLRLELVGPSMAFGHRLYPELVGRASTQGILKRKYVPAPNEPYTPRLRSVSLDYTAACTINFRVPGDRSRNVVYHQHPYGREFLNPYFGREWHHFLTNYRLGTHLYFGLEHYRAGEEVAVLFEINEAGTFDYDTSQNVVWSYASGNHWTRLQPEQISYDTTRNMTRTGLIRFQIADQVLANEILPAGKFWLRCYSPVGLLFARNLLNVHTQAALATFVDRDNDPQHYENHLPVGTITNLYPGDVRVASVQQPAISFGGRAAESRSAFLTRVSERLRHKDRGLKAWDFESLLLEEFPSIEKVICLSHLDEEFEFAPGSVLVIVIPRVRKRDIELRRIPRVSKALLEQMEEFLDRRTSPFVTVRARNAALETVRVNLRVKFAPGFDDITYYKNKLNEELSRLITPWLFEEGAEIQPGQKIYAAQVIRFLDSRPYIDYIANFSIFHFVDDALVPGNYTGSTEQVVAPLSPGAIMVSAARHHFELIGETGAQLEGIGHYAAGIDLTIPSGEVIVEEGIERVMIEKDLIIPDHKPVPGQNINFKLKWN